MKPQSSKLQHREKEETVETQKAGQQSTAHEFQSAEEMLRADAAQTEVPESVKERLAESVQHEVAARKPASWWQRWRRRGNP